MSEFKEELNEELLELQKEAEEMNTDLVHFSKQLRALRKIGDDSDDDYLKKIKDIKDAIQQTTTDLELNEKLIRQFKAADGSNHSHVVAHPQHASKPPTLPSDLPKYIDDQTELLSFFEATEAKLRAHKTPESNWYRALGKQTTGSVLIWVNTHILIPELEWNKAKALFIAEFDASTALYQNREKLINLEHGNGTVATFLRELEQLAPAAQQDLDDPFFLFNLKIRSSAEEWRLK